MQQAYLETLDGKQKELTLDIQHLTPGVRMNRALKALGLFWGMAIGAVFIPMVHFVAVPVLLVLGVVLSIRKWQRTRDIKAQGQCPACGHTMTFDDLRPAAQEYCPQCRHQSRVVFA